MEVSNPGFTSNIWNCGNGGSSVRISPLPLARAVGPKKKKGTSMPMRRRSQPAGPGRALCRAACIEPASTAAALPLPPPSPAATGMFFLISIDRPASVPADPEHLGRRLPGDILLPRRAPHRLSQLTLNAGSAERYRHLIEEAHHLHQHVHVVVAVRPPAEHGQAEIDLCRRPKRYCVSHAHLYSLYARVPRPAFQALTRTGWKKYKIKSEKRLSLRR